MVAGALQLKTMVARDIMTPRVRSLRPETPIPEAIHELLKWQFSEMPIVSNAGEYRGMFSEKCCMHFLATLDDVVQKPHQSAKKASDVMVPLRQLLTVSPNDDVHTAMEYLLKRKCSGAPVINSDGSFLGVFSEKTCMGFVIEAAYNGLPRAEVRGFIDPHSNQLIDGDTDLHTIARIFMQCPYGRLPVMHGNSIAGQLSRCDLLKKSRVLSSIMAHHIDVPEIELATPAADSLTWVEALATLPNRTVSAFADQDVRDISPDMNLFSIARLFLVSSFRRFPVLEGQRLVGQISRCDLLRAVLSISA